jgi:hypothetical protein
MTTFADNVVCPNCGCKTAVQVDSDYGFEYVCDQCDHIHSGSFQVVKVADPHYLGAYRLMWTSEVESRDYIVAFTSESAALHAARLVVEAGLAGVVFGVVQDRFEGAFERTRVFA